MNTPDSKQPHWKPPQSAPPTAIHTPVLTRVIGLALGCTGWAGGVMLIVFFLEAVLPMSLKPSILIGGFHGHVEGADATAKSDPVTALTRKNAEAASQPPAFAGMETEAFRQQQQLLANSMETLSTTANMADGACVVGKIIPRDNRDWGWLGGLLTQTCGVGDQVRQEMMATLKRGGQNNSVLIERPRAPGNGGR